MDDFQRTVKSGNLQLHSPGGFFKKRWQHKYLVLYDGSKSGVKRLELFESEIKFKKQIAERIIPLVDCVRVVTCQRQKSTYTFEVRTSEHFCLFASKTFQDLTDWVNCIRAVAFGETPSAANQTNGIPTASKTNNNMGAPASTGSGSHSSVGNQATRSRLPNAPKVDVLLDPQAQATATTTCGAHGVPAATTAGQAAAAAALAVAKSRQRQPSLLGSCKPQPPTDSPFVPPSSLAIVPAATPIEAPASASAATHVNTQLKTQFAGSKRSPNSTTTGSNLANLDEAEENMLYCSIEDNPSEHNYRVKVIESELSARCQLKCYPLTAPTTVDQQYAQLGRPQSTGSLHALQQQLQQAVFYQLIVGPQELTLLNDYATSRPQPRPSRSGDSNASSQGLWSWPYQCIRRYGFDKDNCFMFEAGRKCSSGPGQFVVQTPKAYLIYQDVVRFVNELRSLNGGGANTGAGSQAVALVASPAVAAGMSVAPNKPLPQITQIPVSWAPSEAHGESGLPEAPSAKQLELSQPQPTPKPQAQNSTSAKPQVPPKLPNRVVATTTTNAPTTTLNPISTPKSDKAATKSQDSNEETDESGYEQGDDSVDSRVSSSSSSSSSSSTSSSSSKSSASATERLARHCSAAAATRKRAPASESSSTSGASMSSPSVSSHSSPASSPGHSVSKRSNGRQVAEVARCPGVGARSRPALAEATTNGNNLNCNNLKRVASSTNVNNGNKDVQHVHLVHHISQDNNNNLDELGLANEDFEANLIRDVYNEITKLHATFAVATHSGSNSEEDLEAAGADQKVSSSSIAPISSTTTANMDSSVSHRVSNSNSKDAQTTKTIPKDDEPTYSNLVAPKAASTKAHVKSQSGLDQQKQLHNPSQRPTRRQMLIGEMITDRQQSSSVKSRVAEFDHKMVRGTRQSASSRLSEFVQPSDARSRYVELGHHDDITDHDHDYDHRQAFERQMSRSYQQLQHHDQQLMDEMDFFGQPQRYLPVYPTVLNPIPECDSESSLIMMAPPKPTRHSSVRHSSTNQRIYSENDLVTAGEKSGDIMNSVMRPMSMQNVRSIADAAGGMMFSRNRFGPASSQQHQQRQNSQEYNGNNKNNQHQQQQLATRRNLRMATNHYLINDVQYAKVSR